MTKDCMARRKRSLCQPNGSRLVSKRGPGSMPFHPVALEKDVEMNYREMHRIISENRHVIDDNTHLQRELIAAKDEIHRLGQIIPELQADKEEKVRELIDKGFNLEADLLASESLRAEVVHLRVEVQKLKALQQELTAEVQGLTKDINQLQAENEQVIAMRADLNAMYNALVDARRAFEYEKKSNEEQVEQIQVMEKNLISMAREIDKLRAELPIAERRVRGLGGGDYGMLNESPDMRDPGSAFDNGCGGTWVHYDKRCLSRR